MSSNSLIGLQRVILLIRNSSCDDYESEIFISFARGTAPCRWRQPDGLRELTVFSKVGSDGPCSGGDCSKTDRDQPLPGGTLFCRVEVFILQFYVVCGGVFEEG